MEQAPHPRPLRITLALWLVLTITAWNAARVWSSLTLRDVLERYAPWPGPLYVGLTGAIWAAGGLLILGGLWRRASWSPAGLGLAAFVYAAWAWLDRLLVRPRIGSDWPFSLVTTALLLAFTAAVALHPGNRKYFGKEAHERE